MYPGQDPRSLNLFSIISPPDLSLSRNLLLSTWWLAQLGSGTVVSLTAQVLVLNKASQYTATGYRRSDWLTGNLLLKVTWIQAMIQINSGDVFHVSVFLYSTPHCVEGPGNGIEHYLTLQLLGISSLSLQQPFLVVFNDHYIIEIRKIRNLKFTRTQRLDSPKLLPNYLKTWL